MRKVICDGCGKDTEAAFREISLDLTDNVEGERIKYTEEFDLCPDCQQKVGNFINKLKKSKKVIEE